MPHFSHISNSVCHSLSTLIDYISFPILKGVVLTVGKSLMARYVRTRRVTQSGGVTMYRVQLRSLRRLQVRGLILLIYAH